MMHEIEAIARQAYETVCLWDGDAAGPCWNDAESWRKSAAINAVLLHQANFAEGARGAHDAWFALRKEQGWALGDKVDRDAKTHPMLIPFEELSLHQQTRNALFWGVVHAMS